MVCCRHVNVRDTDRLRPALTNGNPFAYPDGFIIIESIGWHHLVNAG